MFTISQSVAVGKLQYRHVGAIASLVLISLLSSLSGLSLHHTISNAWDGLLWGVADPVLHLDSLVNILGIGLISTGMLHGAIITISFVLATILGLSTHLLQFSLPGAEIAIAIFCIAFGAMLVMRYQVNWVVVGILGAIAGLFQGYIASQAINGVEPISLLAYALGMALTQYTVASSTREIGKNISRETIFAHIPTIIRFLGFAIVAIGIVLCGNLINAYSILDFGF
ncbi:HupE/UreJ family protein [Anabaena subtropica]|uniref:HupE/UreJ family protein n=1 Tax=Anabaena subtropica FACHB-260 TaxID=2692884 RepID=A0ABR8CI02_9NOST|nr:HupE/UreJ family protein [Anabaena subtropica]MBD2342871.1 HupE/UreJ family protein [Anabaena subtropica FACHB-260]